MLCYIFRLSLKQSCAVEFGTRATTAQLNLQTSVASMSNCAIVSRSGYFWIWSGVRDQKLTNQSSRFVEWKSRYITTWIIKTEVWVICRNRRLKQIKQTWGLVIHEIFQKCIITMMITLMDHSPNENLYGQYWTLSFLRKKVNLTVIFFSFLAN